MCGCAGDCEGGPECLDGEGGPLFAIGRESAGGFMSGLSAQNIRVTQAIGAQLRPAVGDRVHYVSHGSPVLPDGTQAYTSQCRAAIVTEVYWQHTYDESGNRAGQAVPDPGQRVSLAVLNPTGMFFSQAVPFEDARGLTYEGGAESGPQPVQRTGGTWHRADHE